MGNTRMGLSYPDGDDPVDVEKDLKQLACELDHLISLECPEPDYTGWFQYPPDLDGVDGHVVVSTSPLTWDVLPTQDADNGSLRLFDDSHPLYKVYEFDADWDNEQQSGLKQMSWLLDVLQFRGNQISNGFAAFHSMPADELTALPDLDTSNLTSMEYMFQNTPNFNQDISHFDVSNVTGMTYMFYLAAAFNQDIGGWDTGNVTGMGYMFFSAQLFDQDLSGWCVSQIGSKPFYFDVASGFVNQTAKQPKWGAAC